MAWPIPRVPPVIKIVLSCRENRSLPIAPVQIHSLLLSEIAPGTPRGYSSIGTDCASSIRAALFAFGPISQALVSGSYCLIIVAGDPKTTQ
jgi:hypothetical protein